jgi:hypothetical protein
MESSSIDLTHEGRCTICKHSLKTEIEAHMTAIDYAPKAVAMKYGISVDALRRHYNANEARLNGERRRVVVHSAESLTAISVRRIERLWELVETAAAKGDHRGAAAYADQARKYQEAVAKYMQVPGFREEQRANTNINAPGSKFVITGGAPPPAMPSETKALPSGSEEEPTHKDTPDESL